MDPTSLSHILLSSLNVLFAIISGFSKRKNAHLETLVKVPVGISGEYQISRGFANNI